MAILTLPPLSAPADDRGTASDDGLRPGFADPVAEAQRVFRIVLDALARPGRPVPLTVAVEPPPPLRPVSAAILLALADVDTPVWLDGSLDVPAVRNFLRFHCGCPLVAAPGEAAFALTADMAILPPLDAFTVGSDEFPDRSTTLILQVEALGDDGGTVLAGPGIERERCLAATPLPSGFWAAVRDNRALYPRGIDIILAAPAAIAGLPRSIEVRDEPCMSR